MSTTGIMAGVGGHEALCGDASMVVLCLIWNNLLFLSCLKKIFLYYGLYDGVCMALLKPSCR